MSWNPLAALTALALVIQPALHADQAGYTSAESVWVAIPHAVSQVRLRRVTDGSVAATVTAAQRRVVDPASGDSVYAARFGPIPTPGLYYAEVTGLGASAPFRVNADNYDRLLRQLIKGLYYQRCGTAVPAQYGGKWTHAACHEQGVGNASYDWSTTGGAPGGFLNTHGGWHDAGDYGKYSTNNAYAVAVLLQGYLAAPARFVADDAGIPESHNGIPDVLDEARWSLDWMFRMQRPNGSVLHREAVANYAGEFLPELDNVTRYYTDISSDATAAHCGAMALAARAFATLDPAYSTRCRNSAVAAWAWLVAHPARVPAGGFANLYGHTGATYIAGPEPGRRIFAAAEMFKLNGDANAAAYVSAHWGLNKDFNGVWYPDSWGDLENLAAFTYRTTAGADPAIVSGNWWSIQNSLLGSCDTWKARVLRDGYGCAASTDPPNGDYYWGATGVFLRYAWTLVEAYRISGDASYLNAAREQVHYILGRNPMGKVYLTGLGTNPVLHPHGAWNFSAGYTNVSDALCHPVPFLLIGGPNQADNAGLSPYPARCYQDIADPAYGNKGNYTLNETSVNIQTSLIALVGYLANGTAAVEVEPHPAPEPRAILKAFPNPSGGRVSFELEGGAEAGAIRIFSADGRRVRELPASGTATVAWDGQDARGRALPAGVYYARMENGRGAARLVRVR